MRHRISMPPNSPNLNQVDYKVWGVVQERVCHMLICDIGDLKRRLSAARSGMQSHV